MSDLRYRFDRDESGHWYLLPETVTQEEFDNYVGYYEGDMEEEYRGPDLDECRIDSATQYTFLDPRWG